MGTFTWPMTISTLTGEGAREVEALVDTGATYSLAPSKLLEEMGVEPTRTVSFQLADGSFGSLPVGRALVTIGDKTEICPMVFGPDDATPLIGAVTLELLLLVVDPIGGRLIPTHALLL